MSSLKYIKAKKIVLENEIVNNKILVIKDDKFDGIVDSAPSCANVIDYSNNIIVPGYIDSHIHGFYGFDTMDMKKESIKGMSKALLSAGVTTFLPSTLTASKEDLNETCKIVLDTIDECEGAKVEGLFFEGPFFTEKYKGAQNTKYMLDPSIELFDKWQKSANGKLLKIAIAPERENVEEFVKHAVSKGVKVSIGHSNATFDQGMKAIKAGATIINHLYNGMSPLNHREPGMVGAGLFSKGTYAELICDGHHIHPAALSIAMQAKGKENIILITDCMMAGGLEDGNYKLGDFDVVLKDGAVRLQSGSLAGSVLEMKVAVKNIVDWKIATLQEAVNMATINVARSLNIDNKVGSIKEGKFADINVLDDDLELVATYVNGEKKYNK